MTAGPRQVAPARAARRFAGWLRAARIDEFVLAYDEHDAKPYRWTYDGSPLNAA